MNIPIAKSLSSITFMLMLFCWITAPGHAVTLSGTVLDELTESPIAGASVELVNSNAGTGFYTAVTDDEGRFHFPDIRSNLVYDLGVTADGYVVYEMQRWQAPSNQDEVNLRVPLILASTISGTVTASDGTTPLQNIRVTVRKVRGDYSMLNERLSVFSDDEGRFSFDRLPPNLYELELNHAEYIRERITATRLQPGDAKDLSLALIRPALLSGTVQLADDGSPLPDMEIEARGASQNVGTSDANGFFSIENLKPGSYTINSHPSGFNRFSTTAAIQISEGATIEGISIPLSPMPPAIRVSSSRDVYLPDERPEFSLRTFRLGELQCEVVAIPLAVFTEAPSNLRELSSSAPLDGFERALEWTQPIAFNNPYVWYDQSLRSPEALDPGAYVLRLTSAEDNLESRILFYVTDLGLMSKRGDTQTLFFATDLTTSMPVADVRIHVQTPHRKLNWDSWDTQIRDQNTIPWNATTNEDGIAVLDQTRGQSTSVVVALAPNGSFAVARNYPSRFAIDGKNRLMVYTERPLYRPGDTVYYKAILRSRTDEGFRVPMQEQASIRISNSRGETFITDSIQTSEWGSLHSSFEIPGNAPLGSYSIQVSYAGSTQSISFDVEEYRKPEYRVTVDPQAPFYINGDLLEFQTRAEYYFGAPVINARVRYRVYESVRISGGPQGFPSSYSSFLQSGETTTDAEGIARIAFVPRRSSTDRRITVEVDVEEGSGRRVSSRAAVPVGVGEFFINPSAAQTVFDGQNPVAIDISTRTHDNKPVSTKVLVEFIQEVWNPVRRKYVRPSRPLAAMTVTTNDDGSARLEWTADLGLSGNFIVICSAMDSRQNAITAQTRFWRMNASTGNFNYRYPTLEGILDKPSYQPGDEAMLLIHTNYPENPILMTLESADVLSHRVIWPSGKTTRVMLPILESYAPNIHIGLFLPRERRYSQRTLKLSVPIEQGEFHLEIETDRDEYKPGDEATVTVITRDRDDNPTPAEVSLAVVDEALFALRRDKTPDIHRVFYGEQPNWIMTTVSYPMRFFGGANKGVRPDVRKDFRDTATWLPVIHTDETGWATASFRYPDNLTTWRFTALGHTQQTEVASLRTQRRVTKDIVAQLSIPRFFTEDDSLTIPTQVINRTDAPLPEINLTLQTMNGLTIDDSSDKQVAAAANAVARETWDLRVNRANPTASLEFAAQTETASDAVLLTAPILPLGVTSLEHRSAWLTSLTLQWSITPPSSADVSRSTARLVITPSLYATVRSAVDALQAFPYGCMEQIIHRQLPSLAEQHRLHQQAIRPEGIDHESAKRLLQQIITQQKSDGGWSWVSNGASRVDITYIAVDALDRLRALGHPPQRNTMQRAAQYLTRQIYHTREWDTQAMIVHSLSQLEETNVEAQQELITNRNELSTWALAHLVKALTRDENTEAATPVLELLMQRQMSGPGGLWWEALDDSAWTWASSDIETTAHVLSALQATDATPETTRPIVEWLVSQRIGTEWNNTKTTGIVTLALIDWLHTQENENDHIIPVRVSIHDDLVHDATLSGAQLLEPYTIPIDLGEITQETFDIQIKSATGSTIAAFEAEWFSPGMQPQPKPHSSVSMQRVVQRALHAKDYRGRPRILPERLASNDRLSVGSELLVSLSIKAGHDLPFVIIEEALPSGFEVVESFLRTQERGYVPYQRVERRDDRLVFFFDAIPEGELTLDYLIRAELPGTFHVNPGAIWCMYQPTLRAHTASSRLFVDE